MTGSARVCRALLVLASIAQLAVSLSISSRAAAGVIAISYLAPLTLAEESAAATADAAAAASPEQECTEPGTCDSETNSEGTEANAAESTTPKIGSSGNRLITHDDLAAHTGEKEGIWLSILGKVYDVTTGGDFYGREKGSYKFYAGRDASPCFSTGMNNQDGANEKLEEWEDKKLMSVWEWSTFYADHEKYEYLGVLAGSRYYDEEGNEIPLRQDIIARATEAKRIADEEREKKKKERMAAREKKKRDQANNKKPGGGPKMTIAEARRKEKEEALKKAQEAKEQQTGRAGDDRRR